MALSKAFELSQSQFSTSVKYELYVSQADVGGLNEALYGGSLYIN